MSQTLTMNTKERQRLQVLSSLKDGKTAVAKAAVGLALSERQMYRILGRYRSQGDGGLIQPGIPCKRASRGSAAVPGSLP